MDFKFYLQISNTVSVFSFLIRLIAILIPASYLIADESTTSRPNVLFISIDDLNDWVGYMGGHSQAKTPHINALAEQGVAFMHAYCPAPVCGPSRTALMYGIYPHKSGSYGHHKIYSPKNLLPKSRAPLNLVFQNNGYYTAGCGKIFHSSFYETRGWNKYIYGIPGAKVIKTKESLGGNIQLQYGIQETDNDSETGDGRLTDWAIKQLQRKHDRPFFIALGLQKPHLPWDAPRKYYDKHPLNDVQIPIVPEDDLSDIPVAGRTFAHNMVGFSKNGDHKDITSIDGAWRKLVRAYLATCSFADANVGRLIDALKNSPYSDNTLIVLWGDHGWHLGEKNHWRKMTLWERGTRTPFIIKLPGTNANGSKITAPVSLQDIFPTLVDICELKVEQELDGNSLKPLLEEPSTDWDKPVIISHGPGNFAIRKENWRLIHYADGSEELYDISADPNEFKNLAEIPEHLEIRNMLRTHIPTFWNYIVGPRFKKFSSSFAKPKSPE